MSEGKAEYVVSRAGGYDLLTDLPEPEAVVIPDSPESSADELPAGDDLPAAPDPNVEKAKALLRSRKFWAALVGLGMVVLKAYKPDFPVTEEQISNLVYVLMAYILGVALEDGLTAGAVKNAGQ